MKDQTVTAIGIDLGGTKIQLAQVDIFGIVKRQLRLATNSKGGPQLVKRQIVEAVSQLKQASLEPVIGIGIGVAGQIDPHHGIVHFAPNLEGWHEVPLQADLRRALKLPVIVANDVRAATWGEWLFGAGKGSDDIICIFVGTGIGGGIVSAGQMLTGASNTAGEIGHMVIDWKGPVCTCGNRGCWESLAGGWAIAKRAANEVKTDPEEGAYLWKLADQKLKNLTAKLVIQAARDKDPLAARIMRDVQEALVAGAVSLVNAVNPEKLIFGGGIIEGMPKLVQAIEKGVKKQALKSATADLKVASSQLHNDAGVIGAAALAIHQFGIQSR